MASPSLPELTRERPRAFTKNFALPPTNRRRAARERATTVSTRALPSTRSPRCWSQSENPGDSRGWTRPRGCSTKERFQPIYRAEHSRRPVGLAARTICTRGAKVSTASAARRNERDLRRPRRDDCSNYYGLARSNRVRDFFGARRDVASRSRVTTGRNEGADLCGFWVIVTLVGMKACFMIRGSGYCPDTFAERERSPNPTSHSASAS